MTSAADLTTAFADRYQIERELGTGGMATVYLAHDVKHDRKVAIKVLRPELAAVLGAERFVQEIKTTANLQHPHILPLFDSGEAGSFLYYVMPHIEGETLRDKLDRETQLGIDEAVKIATEVADALDYAHRHNVIHRDIKPENILLHDGRPMVADFGIALAVSAAAAGRMTETGLSLGTPHYMSPEQATADKDLTNRSDIYSLGAMLYEMLTGNPPHVGSSAQQIIMKIVTEEAAPVTDSRKSVPSNVAAAVAKALEKLPADRFSAAGRFAAALADPGFRGTHPSPEGAPVASRKREVAAWTIAAVFALLFLWNALSPSGASLELPATRFTISVPDGHVMWGLADPQLAVSPDGRSIAYVSNGTLYVRRLAAEEPVALYQGDPNSLGFSPDSRSLMFGEGNQIRRVSASGGAATTIPGAARFGAGGDWASDGIYFTKVDGVYRVADDGGVTRLTTLASESEATHRWPQRVGNDLLLYTVVGPSLGWDDSKLVLHDLSADSRVWEREGAMYGRYVSSGHILYGRADGTVLIQPFDLDDREPSGPPTPLLQGLRVGEDLGAISFAVSDGGTLVYTTPDKEGSHVIQRRDRAGRIIGKLGDAANWDQPHLSPDGTRLAVVRREPTNDDIWLIDISTGIGERFTFDLREEETPVWSPDATQIVYTAYGGRQRHTYRQRIGGGQPELMHVSDFHTHVTSWSPDGRWLLTHYIDSLTQDDIWALELGDSVVANPVLRSSANELVPVFSPDGRWFAYMSDENGARDIFVQRWPPATAKYQLSHNGGTWPQWSADGRSLVFFQPEADSALVMEARLRFQPRFERLSLDTLFAVHALDASRGIVALPDGDVLLPAFNTGIVAYEIHVVENFVADVSGDARD